MLDVAGGKGALAFELANLNGVPATVLDPRPLSLSRHAVLLQARVQLYLSRRKGRSVDAASGNGMPTFTLVYLKASPVTVLELRPLSLSRRAVLLQARP